MSLDSDRLKEALADRYTIEREIGRGGMAVVYLATLTGDETGAIEAYYIYLALRDQPTGYEPWDAERRAVQEELAALISR